MKYPLDDWIAKDERVVTDRGRTIADCGQLMWSSREEDTHDRNRFHAQIIALIPKIFELLQGEKPYNIAVRQFFDKHKEILG